MLAKNISGRKIKVEYGFNSIRKRELLQPDQVIEIDDFDYNYLTKLGVFAMGEMTILNSEKLKSEEEKMKEAKEAAQNYINEPN